MKRKDVIKELRKAWRQRRLTLCCGAGVSVGNGLPTWERLVVAMYFDRISRDQLDGWRPFVNYLYAIAEWHLERIAEPLEITARRLRGAYDRPENFLEHLRHTLYAGLSSGDEDAMSLPPADALCAANRTLAAVTGLCAASSEQRGVNAVITYNYDNLIEHVLAPAAATDNSGRLSFEPVFTDAAINRGSCPIYHVHGYVPAEGDGSSADQIVFTEDQYHLAAADPYAWQNLVQLNSFASTTGCMVGLSLSDPNTRRLLDAVMRTPSRGLSFALLEKQRWPAPTDETVDAIDQKARDYLDRFAHSGVKSRAMTKHAAGYLPPGVKARGPAGGKGPRYRSEIRGILEAVESIDVAQQTTVLRQLGIEPIWYEDHGEIPEILEQLK